MNFGKKKPSAPTAPRMTLAGALEIVKSTSLHATAAKNYQGGVRAWTESLLPAFEALGVAPPYFQSLQSRLEQMAHDPSLTKHLEELVRDARQAFGAGISHLGAVQELENRESAAREKVKRASEKAKKVAEPKAKKAKKVAEPKAKKAKKVAEPKAKKAKKVAEPKAKKAKKVAEPKKKAEAPRAKSL